MVEEQNFLREVLRDLVYSWWGTKIPYSVCFRKKNSTLKIFAFHYKKNLDHSKFDKHACLMTNCLLPQNLSPFLQELFSWLTISSFSWKFHFFTELISSSNHKNHVVICLDLWVKYFLCKSIMGNDKVEVQFCA